MTKTMKQLVEDARSRVEAISPVDAAEAAAIGNLILDVREPAELEQNGRLADALHVPRGVLESRADLSTETTMTPLTAMRDGGRVLVLCASGGRAALAADTLRVMGYEALVIEGGMTDWKANGLPVED
ncbi:sulfurtransferase [Tabrizicola sp. WMC-M-20]|nr:sulfurtransferase [Tabrizicola sp. WMC-M-20]